MKTLIAVPCMDSMPTEFVKSLLYLKKDGDVQVYFRQSSLIYHSRNFISVMAMENKYDWVLWLDSDMCFEPDTLTRLQEDMANDGYNGVDMVTGLYVTRKPPFKPVIYETVAPPSLGDDGVMKKNVVEYIGYPKDQLFPVAGCGFGCVLTKVSLLKEVWDKFGPAFTPNNWTGEDLAFCYRVNLLGKNRIWCDSGISCGHIGQMIYDEQMLDDK
jgi:GT2 family glycosyltransferase